MATHWIYLAMVVALLQGILSLNPTSGPDEEWADFSRQMRDSSYRLPTTSRPRLYEISLTPYFENAPANMQFTFDGEVTIYTIATEHVNEIVLHCDDITINSVSVEYTANSGVIYQIAAPNQNFVCEAPRAFLRIATTEMLLVTQEYRIRIVYRGNLQTDMRGFYRSWYVDSSGTRRWMGTTQFQPGFARRAFPCYDEPNFKAYFDITINREPDFSPSISNMPIRSTDNTTVSGRVSDTFYTTPWTSTYLIAFIVSHYEVVATNNDLDRPFDIYARDNVGTTGQWSLVIGEKLLQAMETYTNISYYEGAVNLNMKQAAIPDFNSGAMENWGLLTYREAFLLYDPNNSNHFYKQRVANIVSHEIVHMWFGNLVTCAWWDNLWLNEGFARFHQYFLTDSVVPELGYTTRFIVEQFLMCMEEDSVDTSHALTEEVYTPDIVWAHFSPITYAKGASILRMTQHLLGDDTFIKGIRAYLKSRAFDVAEPHHLFDALDTAAIEDRALATYPGITIDRYFRTWSEKPGHPLLSVFIDQSTGEMTVIQSRWERTDGTSDFPGLWDIPITWTREGAADFEDLKPSQFITTTLTFINRGTQGNEWVIFNKQATGFYRVNYDIRNWALLTQALREDPNVIHEYNRAQIIDDLFNFGRAGVLPYERVFNIMSFLEFDDQYAPWIAAIDGFSFVRRRLAHDADQLEKLHEMIRGWSTAVTRRLGYAEIEGEPFMDGLLRMYVMNFLCDIGHVECIAAGRSNFLAWRNGQTIPPNMRSWVYCVGLRDGTADDFNYFWSRYLDPANDLASEHVVVLQAAGCTSDEASLELFLNAIVEDPLVGSVRPQDFATAISSAVTRNEYNTLRAFNWLRSNVAQTINTLGSIASPLSNIGPRLLNENDINMYEAWLNDVRETIGTAYNTGISGAATARSQLNWSDRRMSEFATFFETGYMEDDVSDTTPPPPEPDSANIAALSAFTLLIAVAVNFVN